MRGKFARSGPVEVVEFKGVKIPIYASPAYGKKSYVIAFYADGKRVRERYSTLENARQEAKKKVKDLTSGAAHVASLTPRQVAIVTDAVELLRETGASLSDAAREYAAAAKVLNGRGSLLQAVQHYAAFLTEEEMKGSVARISVSEIIEKFQTHLKDHEKSKRYIGDIRARLGRFKKSFTCLISEIKANDIDAWLLGFRGASPQTRLNYRTAVCSLFSFAREKGFLPRGVQTEAEFSTRPDARKSMDIGIYTPDQITLLLKRIDRTFIPFLALGGFAGLRSAEIVRTEWSDIRWEQKVIEIRAAKAKTASRRLVPILPALAAWLAPWKNSSGPVLDGIPDEFALSKKFKKAAESLVDDDKKPLVKMVHNGLRHSYISYRLAAIQDAAKVSLEAGNSPKMVFQHYRELVTPSAAEKWFSVLPGTMVKA